MNFLNSIKNSNLNYKAMAVKFILLSKKLYIRIPQIIKHIKLIKSKIHYRNQKIKYENFCSIDQHDSNKEHRKILKIENIHMFNGKIMLFTLNIISYIITIMIIFKVKIHMFYERISDCQLTNENIAKLLKYMNNNIKDDVQYIKDKIYVIYQTDIQNKVIKKIVLKNNRV